MLSSGGLTVESLSPVLCYLFVCCHWKTHSTVAVSYRLGSFGPLAKQKPSLHRGTARRQPKSSVCRSGSVQPVQVLPCSVLSWDNAACDSLL